MKTRITFLLIMFLALTSNAVAQQVIATAGGYFQNQEMSMSWTVGEPVIETFTGAEVILTQGFQQPYNFYLTQLISVPAGWSGISSYVDPLMKSVETIFEPFSTDFIILSALDGYYYPAGGINTLGNWSTETGYQIKAANAFDISMTGAKITDPTVELQTGWNLMPVMVSCVTGISDLFAGTTGLKMVKEVAGAGVFWPEYNIVTLSELVPGKAYWVAIENSTSVTYPACSKSNFLPGQPVQPQNKSPWNNQHFTSLSHPVAFKPGILFSAGAEAGDIIGVFSPEGLCTGLSEITDPLAGLAVIAFADDPTTPEKDGFAYGELFQFKLYRFKLNQEFNLVLSYDESLPNTNQFEANGMSAVNEIESITYITEDNLQVISGIFPNPNDGQFSLALSHWPGNLLIELYDSRGTVLKRFYPGTNLSGSSFHFDLQQFPAGVYFLKLIDRTITETKKVVIHHF